MSRGWMFVAATGLVGCGGATSKEPPDPWETGGREGYVRVLDTLGVPLESARVLVCGRYGRHDRRGRLGAGAGITPSLRSRRVAPGPVRMFLGLTTRKPVVRLDNWYVGGNHLWLHVPLPPDPAGQRAP